MIFNIHFSRFFFFFGGVQLIDCTENNAVNRECDLLVKVNCDRSVFCVFRYVNSSTMTYLREAKTLSN